MSDSFFVPPGHFYSPHPDATEAERAVAQARARDVGAEIPGVTLSDSTMLDTWRRLLPFMQRVPFSEGAGGAYRYYWNNDFFSYGDASVYFAFMATLAPRRIIEIGSGYSSALALDTREFLALNTELTFIEPYPRILKTLLRSTDEHSVVLLEKKVQDVERDRFTALEANDILFIDSSHVMKTGSDVCHEIFEILPALKPGVVVHFHDIFFPFEYPTAWVLNDKRAWNELYALRAFLMYNSAFEIIFFNDYFMKRFPQEAADPSVPFAKNSGGGLWMVRR